MAFPGAGVSQDREDPAGFLGMAVHPDQFLEFAPLGSEEVGDVVGATFFFGPGGHDGEREGVHGLPQAAEGKMYEIEN